MLWLPWATHKGMPQNGPLDEHPARVAVQTAILCYTFLCVAQGNQSMGNSSMPFEKMFLFWDCPISLYFYRAAREGAKISSYEPVSSQKYENRYRRKICDFTVSPVRQGKPVYPGRRSSVWNILIIIWFLLWRCLSKHFDSLQEGVSYRSPVDAQRRAAMPAMTPVRFLPADTA